jgi:phage-related protein
MSISVLVGELATIPATVAGQINELTATASDACDILGMLGSLLGQLFSEAAINAILKALAAFAAPFFKLIGDIISLISGLADAFLSFVEGIVNEILAIVALIAGVVATVAGLISGIAAFLGDLVRSLKAAACKGILDVATSVIGGVGSGDASLSSLGDAALVAGGNLLATAAGAAAASAANAASAAASSIAGNIVGDLANATSSITGKVADLQSAIALPI